MSETIVNDDLARRGNGVAAEFESSLHRLRGSLTELLASVGADPNLPQDISRRFGINRNLAWKVSRIINAEHVFGTAHHLPGSAGVEILLEAFRKAGAPDEPVNAVAGAVKQFDDLVEIHTGDRATLELMLSAMLPAREQIERQESARKLAYQGGSASWGVQAKVRLSAHFLAPNPDDAGVVDTAVIGGLIGYRRLRAGASWLLLRQYDFNDDGSPREQRTEAIDPSVDPSGLPLMPAFSSPALPEIERSPIPGGTQYDLGDGPVGNTGAVDAIFGYFSRPFAPLYRDEHNRFGEHLVHWRTPAEVGLADLYVHRDLPLPRPEAALYARVDGGPPYPIGGRERNRLPLAESIQDLGAGPPVVATALVPRYSSMIDAVFERLGWDPAAFIGYRFTMRYPAIPTLMVYRYPLPERT